MVYFFITWAYCYADCFTASIPYVLKIPRFMPVKDLASGVVTSMKTKEACKPTPGREVLLDDKYNTVPHYHNPVTELKL